MKNCRYVVYDYIYFCKSYVHIQIHIQMRLIQNLKLLGVCRIRENASVYIDVYIHADMHIDSGSIL